MRRAQPVLMSLAMAMRALVCSSCRVCNGAGETLSVLRHAFRLVDQRGHEPAAPADVGSRPAETAV